MRDQVLERYVGAEPGLFRPVHDLRRRFAEAGLTASAEAMVYCRVSERSAPLWFALHELLGHARTRHYDGGWAEYGSLVDVPVVREVDRPHGIDPDRQPSPAGADRPTA